MSEILSEEEAVDLERKRLDCMHRQDVAQLERLLNDKFTFTHLNGLFEGKEEFLGRLREGDVFYNPITLTEIVANTFADCAIINAHASGSIEVKSIGKTFPLNNRIISVWLRIDGAWQAVAYQSTPVSD